MDNLSKDQINEYIAALGSNIVVDSSEFDGINASGEAAYKVVVDGAENHIYIRQLANGNLRADIASLV